MQGRSTRVRCGRNATTPAVPQAARPARITQTPAKQPSKEASSALGLLPELRARELMMGMKMPPARAVVEGMAGAMHASATAGGSGMERHE